MTLTAAIQVRLVTSAYLLGFIAAANAAVKYHRQSRWLELIAPQRRLTNREPLRGKPSVGLFTLPNIDRLSAIPVTSAQLLRQQSFATAV